MRTVPGEHVTTASWLAEAGRTVHRLHPSLHGLTATLSVSDVAVLSEDPSIAGLSIDAVVTATRDDDDDDDDEGEILLETLGLEEIDNMGGWTGAGVGVALIDSGIEGSRDFDDDQGVNQRITAFYDFTQGGIEVNPYDDYGHGTHVAGLVGGNGDTEDYEGAAPEAHLVVYKVLDAQGAGYTSDVVAAIDHAVAFKDDLDIDVMNLSLGHPIL